MQTVAKFLVLVVSIVATAPAVAAMPAQPENPLPGAYRLVSSTQAANEPDEWDKLSPDARMKRRWPQPVKVGFLVGLPILDYDDSTIGHVRKVVRTNDGKILLIVAYGRWYTFKKRFVAVPIETVAILGRQINALEMLPEDFEKAPTWNDSTAQDFAPDATIQIAISRR